MIIPFLPFGTFSFQTNLSLEKAIEIRGRDLDPQREIRNGQECMSFNYRPPQIYWYSRASGRQLDSSLVVHVRYLCEADGVLVKVKIIPHPVYFIGFLILCFLFICISMVIHVAETDNFPSIISYLPILLAIIGFALIWREIVGIKSAFLHLFRDHKIKGI